jgi:site-specific DNA-cytosine methylase
MRYFSLFSGIGGFELGITQAYESNLKHAHVSKEPEQKKRPQRRVRSTDKRKILLHTRDRSAPLCVGYSEIDKYAIQIYEKHFKHKNFGDIRKIKPRSLPDFDLLIGGFPCQSFSVAGKRKGFKDTRGTLFFEIARIIATKRPKLLLLENVKGLLSHDGGRTFGTILSSLDELGYDVQWEVLNSKNFGVPQNRERVFVVGHLRNDSRPEIFSLRKDDEGNSKQHVPKSQASRGVRNMSDLKSRWRHSMRIRKLTPKECERLQGFPDGWTEGVSDTQRYKTLGNAVTVNVVVEIAKRIIDADKNNYVQRQ